MGNPYEILEVSPGVDQGTLTAAYKRKVREVHPDAGGSAEAFREVRRAYEAIRSGEADPPDHPTDEVMRGTDGTAAGSTSTRAHPSTGRSAGASGPYPRVSDLFPLFRSPVDTDAVLAALPPSLYGRRGPVTIALVGLVETDIADVVFRHQVDDKDSSVRTVAIFHVRNTGNADLRWDGWTKTEFLGSDGATYDRSEFQMDPYDSSGAFPPHLTPQFADLEPGDATNGLLIVEQLPADVRVDGARYTQRVTGAAGTGRERFEFSVEPSTRDRLRTVELGR